MAQNTSHTLAQLDALWKRFDTFPEVTWVEGGALLKRDAYVAFLDARKLIDQLRQEFHAADGKERSRIVSYLRGIAEGSAVEDALRHVANSIESGIHWDDEQ